MNDPQIVVTLSPDGHPSKVEAVDGEGVRHEFPLNVLEVGATFSNERRIATTVKFRARVVTEYE